MRVVNMAHGAFFLLGGYITLKLQRAFVGQDSAFGLLSSQVHFWEWLVPSLIAAVCIAILGLGTQQIFLRWNQGQDLRQALITLAVSVIFADQMVAHYGGVVESIQQPTSWPNSITIGSFHYPFFRLVVVLGAGRDPSPRRT